MEQSKNDVKLGKFISLVLRHQPDAAGVKMDENGWVEVDALIAGMNRAGRHINRETLERIVRENQKQRYCFDESHARIRANQGHSLAVDVELRAQTPPDILYHGTADRFLQGIQCSGLVRQNRQHVHLSADVETAVNVGRRHGKPLVLKVDAAAMTRDGFLFWLSENGVWLCESVPWKYLSAQAETQPKTG